ncbi:hypothetical protein [Bacillus toyonensis]|nr:hypothetical protein [Bacillus toyonensis]
MMGALKNHRDERVSVSVEELVPQDHSLRAIEATIGKGDQNEYCLPLVLP